jgi:uncharacterized MAPEG superfamily protein
MILAIIACLGLYLVYVLVPPSLLFLGGSGRLSENLSRALGPRDSLPEGGLLVERSKRALRNFEESLPFFLTLALILHFQDHGANTGIGGAWAFVGARVLYLPSYLSGIPGIRSLIWMIGSCGIIAMLLDIIPN